MAVYQVNTTALNFRTEPEVREDTKKAKLKKGHLVKALDSASDGWMQVSTHFEGEELKGYVSSDYLAAVPDLTSLQLKVTATALNIRSSPEVKPETKLAVLPNGHEVKAVTLSEKEGWVQVATELDGNTINGHVSMKYLAAEDDHKKQPTSKQVEAVHFYGGDRDVSRHYPERTEDPDQRDYPGGRRPCPLNEEGRPTRNPEASKAEKVNALKKIIEWLDVENSGRYDQTSGNTYCNVYAYDYCYLANVYLPRVWWKEKALLALNNGKSVSPRYGETVHEMNANSLFDWLREWGPEFGWQRIGTQDLNNLQQGANAGKVGIICGKHQDPESSGHITVVAPEDEEHTAMREGGNVIKPLQSQAGRNNEKYTVSNWWQMDYLAGFGFWLHV